MLLVMMVEISYLSVAGQLTTADADVAAVTEGSANEAPPPLLK